MHPYSRCLRQSNGRHCRSICRPSHSVTPSVSVAAVRHCPRAHIHHIHSSTPITSTRACHYQQLTPLTHFACSSSSSLSSAYLCRNLSRTMSSLNVYRRPLESMQYFHRHHQSELEEMISACRSANSLRNVQRLAYSLRSFSSGLHGHHTIEDRSLFPFLASRTDIRHLAAHHLQLDTALASLDSLADRLLRLKELDGYDGKEAEAVVVKVQALVVEHENAEEAVLAADNLQKCMTEEECRRWWRH